MRKYILLSVGLLLLALGSYWTVSACCGTWEPPPSISALSCDPDTLWPPNHKYVAVTVKATTNTGDRWDVASVTSDQPDDADGVGDGETINDSVIGDKGSGAGDQRAAVVNLRAERCGVMSRQGVGRTYTIVVRAWNTAGQTFASCSVYVPHDQK